MILLRAESPIANRSTFTEQYTSGALLRAALTVPQVRLAYGAHKSTQIALSWECPSTVRIINLSSVSFTL